MCALQNASKVAASLPALWVLSLPSRSLGRGCGGDPCAQAGRCTHLRCVRKLPLTWPEPSQPGVGQDMPSVLTDFQENWEPLR